jgi:hypothetical protein
MSTGFAGSSCKAAAKGKKRVAESQVGGGAAKRRKR